LRSLFGFGDIRQVRDCGQVLLGKKHLTTDFNNSTNQQFNKNPISHLSFTNSSFFSVDKDNYGHNDNYNNRNQQQLHHP